MTGFPAYMSDVYEPDEGYGDRIYDAGMRARHARLAHAGSYEACAACHPAADPLAPYDGSAGDLVPGYAGSADGQADAADQARADRGNR